MTKEEILKIVQEAVASAIPQADNKKVDHEALANTSAKIAETIIQSNKTFVEAKEKAEQKAVELETKSKEQEAKITDLEEKVSQASESIKVAQDKISGFEKEKEASLAKASFDARMTSIDEDFEIGDQERAVLAKQVLAIASDKDFEAYKENLKVVMSSKLKTNIALAKASDDKKLKEALASELTKRGIVDPLEKGSDDKSGLSNGSSGSGSDGDDSIRARMSRAFTKETIKVS